MTLSFPDSPQAITPGWLTEALAATAPGVEVTRVEVLAEHSGTTGRARIGVEYAPGAEGPATLFAKLAPFNEAQRGVIAFTDMGRREARFYAGPAAEVPLRIPRSYYAAHGEEPGQYVMLLEDLAASGARFTTRLESHAEELAPQLVDGLAHLHAHFWADPRFDEEFSWLTGAMRGAFGAQLIAKAREQFAADFPPVFDELCRLYVDDWEAIADLWDEGPHTLIHGDTHAGNQFLDRGRAGLYDWAVISRSPGIRDLAIYFGNSCPPQLRRDNLDGWLQRYHGILTEAAVEPPSLEQLTLQLRRTVLYAWVAATTTATMGSQWQPIEVAREGMTTATIACAELETIEAIRSAL